MSGRQRKLDWSGAVRRLHPLIGRTSGQDRLLFLSPAREETRTPTWEEMCFVKNAFFEPEDIVVQIHPPLSKYVNLHPHVLHLWRPHRGGIKMPPQWMV